MIQIELVDGKLINAVSAEENISNVVTGDISAPVHRFAMHVTVVDGSTDINISELNKILSPDNISPIKVHYSDETVTVIEGLNTIDALFKSFSVQGASITVILSERDETNPLIDHGK